MVISLRTALMTLMASPTRECWRFEENFAVAAGERCGAWRGSSGARPLLNLFSRRAARRPSGSTFSPCPVPYEGEAEVATLSLTKDPQGSNRQFLFWVAPVRGDLVKILTLTLLGRIT